MSEASRWHETMTWLQRTPAIAIKTCPRIPDTAGVWLVSALPSPQAVLHLPARQVKLDSEVSSVFVSGWGEGGLVLLWRVSSGGYDHSELPEELFHPKATWIS